MRKKKVNSKIPYSLELQSQRFLSALHERNRTRRITALVMAVVILFTSLFTTVAISESNVSLALERGPSAGVSNRVADDDTMDTYIDRLISKEAGSRYSGRLWADKSVFNNGSSVTLDMRTDGYNGTVSSNADFLHAFSALGSSQMVSTGETIPIDVVFVLDVSGSMKDYPFGQKQEMRAKRLIRAVNNAIDELNKLNPYNRVGIALYANTGAAYLPLVNFVSYTDETYQEWIYEYEDSSYKFGFRLNGNMRKAISSDSDLGEGIEMGEEGWTDVYSAATFVSQLSFGTDSGLMVGYTTNMQSGIAAGMGILANEPVTTWTSPQSGVTYDRIPVVVVMTDGGCNTLCTSNDPSDTNDAQAWYNTNFNNRKNTLADDDAEKYIASSVVPTLLTAAYNMALISKNYEEAPHAYGVAVDNPGNVQNVKIAASLNPSEETLKAATGTLGTTDYDTNAYELIESWKNLAPNQSLFVGPLPNTGVAADSNIYVSQLPEGSPVTTQDVIDNLYFTEGFYDVDGADLNDVFSDIINDILEQGQAFPPLNGSNGAGVEDALTYADPIGEYMEIKDGAIVHDEHDENTADMSMLLLGEMYDLEKTGIYDYHFNNDYLIRIDQPNGILTDGWYSSDDPEPAEYLGNEDGDGSWEKGNFRFVSYKTAAEYVSKLAEVTEDKDGNEIINGNDATEKQQNTVYTFYRIIETDEIGDVDVWRLNPAYEGRIPELQSSDYNENFVLNEALQKEYTELAQAGQSLPSGVYRLNDIRIWVEDTGDFKDKYPDDTLFVGMGYDQALYVNVPAGALPIQVAEILLDDAGVASYVTNLGADHEGENQDFYYQQSTPLRVFYSVGLEKEIVTNDGVDLTKVSQTYLDSHRNDDNSVYFLSNYFTGDGNEEYKGQGDPVITFSPGINNRFYVFQKTLAFYTKAYRWDGTGFDEVTDITNWEGGELKGIFKTVAEAGTEGYDRNDIIFLSGDVANTEIKSDGTYFWTFECYVSDGSEARAQVREGATGGRTVNYVLARKGSDFIAKDFDNLQEHDMINWYDTETGATQPYNDGKKPEAEGTWVLATHVGGLRLSELASFAKNDNTTQTAEYYYTPAVSGSSGSGEDVLINAYLGNNGCITIEDTLFLVTKLVAPYKNTQLTSSQLANEEFTYQIYIEDFVGARSAIKVKWDNDLKLWWRRISTIDVLTTNEGLLQDLSHNPVKVNANGESDPNGSYYVYVPSFSLEDSGNNVSRVYSATENGEFVNGSSRIKPDKSKDFMADIVYLVPVDNVIEGWDFDLETDGKEPIENGFVIANMEGSDINDRGSGYGPTSDFAIRTQYVTVDMVFGVNYKNENGEEITDVAFKAPTELFDNKTFYTSGQVPLNKIAQHTAQFTLKHGEGILFNGIKFGGDYRITEKLPMNQLKDGWRLWNENDDVNENNFNDTLRVAAFHIRAGKFTNYDHKGDPTDVWSVVDGEFVDLSGESFRNTASFDTENHVYSVFGETSHQEEAVQYTNTIVPAAMEISKVVVGDHDDGDVYTFNIEYYAIDENGDEIPLPDGTYHAYIHATDHECSLENHPHVEGETTGNCENDLILTDGKGSVVLKDGETYVICGLPQGTYYKITESIEIKDGMVYDYVTGFDITDDAGSRHVNDLTATGYLNTADENDTVKVVRVAYTNRAVLPEPGDLTVSKTVGGFGATGKDTDWHFTVTLTPPDFEHFDTTYDFVGGVIAGTGATSPGNGSLTFTRQENGTYTAQITLKHGQTITLKDLPYGTDYSVTEDKADQDGYTTTVTGDAGGTINFDREVGFVNTPYGSLEVEKEVVGEDPDSKEFNFTVTLIGEGLDPKKLEVSGDSDITWTVDGDGTLKGAFTLSDGQSIIISNIPADVTYKVEEEKLDDYAVEKAGDEGTVKVGETATAHFINMLVYNFPELGGIGTLPFQLPGVALITIALLCVILMKKRQAKTTKS